MGVCHASRHPTAAPPHGLERISGDDTRLLWSSVGGQSRVRLPSHIITWEGIGED